MMDTLTTWIERQYRHSATAMLASFAPPRTHARPGFGQSVRPVKGSIVASPVPGAYDPDPDYYFHWFRDSAVIIDALRLLEANLIPAARARELFADFVRFSLALQDLDGGLLCIRPGWRAAVAADFERYVRSAEDLAAVSGEAVYAEARVNPDGTLDISKWARPQHDGPPLRALAVLRWARHLKLEGELAADVAALLRADLAFTLERARLPSFDIWEEEKGFHYYTLRVGAAALEEGAGWLRDHQSVSEARICREQAHVILQQLDEYWLVDRGYFRSRLLEGGTPSAKELDMAVIFAAIHASGAGPEHSVHDPRMHATLTQLERLFDKAYPINHGRPPQRGPAMGRYAGDVYFSGGAYYFSTLAAAEFCYRASLGHPDAAQLRRRGDAFLETVRTFTPADGALSEQFDQKDGKQTSAKELAWSYAAFISCIHARRAALAAVSPTNPAR